VSRTVRAAFWVALVTMVACARGEPATERRHFGLGRAATAQEITARDIDAGADGAGLPPGSGTVAQGQQVFAQKCATCHGARGEGILPLYPRLVGRDPSAETFVFGSTPGLPRTIGNYWPYATTVYDYVRRAMPLTAPGSLTSDEVYAVTAYLLAANNVIPQDTRLDSAALKAVRMPYVSRFVPDNRHGGREVK
jgi:mono/diheme cytochrome c family protein